MDLHEAYCGTSVWGDRAVKILILGAAITILSGDASVFGPEQVIIYCCDHDERHCGKRDQLPKLVEKYDCKNFSAEEGF